MGLSPIDSRYKVQYGDKERFGQWSDWMDAETTATGAVVASVVVSEEEKSPCGDLSIQPSP